MDKQNQQTEVNASAGSDVELIEVHTPNFFERHFLHLLTIFGVGFLLFTFIFQIYFTPIHIVGRSMQPTINTESISNIDRKHVDLVYYKQKDSYKKNDIVVVDGPKYLSDTTDSIIKRIIATEGDTLTFNVYEVISNISLINNLHQYSCYYTIDLNGEPIVEDYIKEQECYINIMTNNAGEYIDSADYHFTKLIWQTLLVDDPTGYITTGKISYTLTESQAFVCGDNRNNSTDSRYFGAINTADILGAMEIHIPYGSNLFVAIWKKIFA